MQNISEVIQDFFETKKRKRLNLHFDQLDIFSFYQGEFLNLKSRKSGRVVITKTANPRLMNMKVMDQIIFSCALEFTRGKKSKMQKVPEPLARGHIEMDADRFVLQYTLESPKKDRQLQFCFVYQKLQDFKGKNSSSA
ncbi:hypothetical protein [Flagellimonas sp.]|uniref:hypothetical protein n=1 Tax=Flagellimonas sp. TaxID=2058762 RepID=UPI003F4A130C